MTTKVLKKFEDNNKSFTLMEGNMYYSLSKDEQEQVRMFELEDKLINRYFRWEKIKVIFFDLLIGYIFLREFIDFPKHHFLILMSSFMILSTLYIVLFGRRKFLNDCKMLNLQIDNNFNARSIQPFVSKAYNHFLGELREHNLDFKDLVHRKFSMNDEGTVMYLKVIYAVSGAKLENNNFHSFLSDKEDVCL